MKIFGHKAIPCLSFQKVKHIQDIDHTLANSIIWFDEDLDYQLGNFCLENQVPYAFKAHNIKDFLIYSALGAKYILVESNEDCFENLAKEYLLDLSILKIIDSEDEIEKMAQKGIDGVIFRSFLDKKS